METKSSNTLLGTIRYSKRKKWTVKEKKIILTLLRKYGHQNLQHFFNSLPHRTELEIKRLLKKYKTSVEKKLRLKHDENVERTLATIHPWISFMNNYCNSDSYVHENLIAFTLPFMEHYLKHPNATHSDNVNFKWAYRALFNSLVGYKFPQNMNYETAAMIYASLTQLFDDIRTEQSDHRNILSKCVERCFQKKPDKAQVNIQYQNNAIQLPEVNILQLTSHEINRICKK